MVAARREGQDDVSAMRLLAPVAVCVSISAVLCSGKDASDWQWKSMSGTFMDVQVRA